MKTEELHRLEELTLFPENFRVLESMTVQEALEIVDNLLKSNESRGLTDIQEVIFRHAWDGHSYLEIAHASGYDAGYIRDVGARLWRSLSLALGEKVSKNNFRAALRRYQQSQ
ncbi:hypothetical protein [Geitlerinema sp. PCC 7407]|uniref:hypothetical protein n=1 Tax=Geitlerinema sp. PCC 7407 TaxID=1173025 RepID=UPI00029FDFF8|nr:hypothetical protein [Geitlerinema sp. PCC 7407]AFY67329.1 hypothetical protein GEI7407_2858 [Geitlerinema sp. PCC 7407]